MKYFLFLLIAAIPLTLLAQPWGKDADLAVPPAPTPCPLTPPTLLARFGEKAIRFHQEVISPADGPRSNFIPSSSQYTLDAMRKYGFCTGFMRGCDRLMRENDDSWVYRKTLNSNGKELKWDPVK